jgi:hypothetical protein
MSDESTGVDDGPISDRDMVFDDNVGANGNFFRRKHS